MAYLNGTFLGYSTMQYQLNTIDPVSYNKVTLYGGQSIFSKVHIQNVALTNEQIQAINPTDDIIWKSSTLLLANFSHTLDGGNIVYLPSALVGWKIYRKEVGSEISVLIGTMDAGNSIFVDYAVSAYKNFTYEIIPYTGNELGSPIVTDEIYTDFFGYYLMNMDGTDNVYKFELEAKGSDYQNNENFVEYKSYTEFNSYAIGKSKFFNTSVSALFGTVNADGTFTQSSETLLQLRDFIQNGKLKYFKDKKGNIFAGLTHNYKQSVLDNGIQSQPFTISFDFVETQKI